MITGHQGLVASVLVSRCPIVSSVALSWIVSLTCLWDPLELVLATNTNTPSILRYPTDALGPVNALVRTLKLSKVLIVPIEMNSSRNVLDVS